jgi:hypothetical protein
MTTFTTERVDTATEALFDYLPRPINYGASITVLEHEDPTRVWIVSFDLARHHMWTLLGIDVGELHTGMIEYTTWHYPDKVHVFDCEKLTRPTDGYEDLKEWYKEVWDPAEIPLPQPLPAAQSLVYAIAALTAMGWTFDKWDWCTSNMLVRPDGEIILSDVFYWEGAFGEDDVVLNEDSVHWIKELVEPIKEVV